MHDERAFAWVEQLGAGGIAAAAVGSGIVAVLALPAFTPLIADVVLVLAGATGLAGSGWAWTVRRRLMQMPLELGPVAGRGHVDGRDVLRVRARLGRGRALRDPEAVIHYEPEVGAPVPLEVLIPARSLCGPFTLVVPDVPGPGHLRVRLTVRSGRRSWQAEASYPTDKILAGRFDRFDDGWDRLLEDP